MDISLFLARAFGLYLLIMGIALLINPKTIKAAVAEIGKNASLELFSGALALIIGILVVLSHNIWHMDWRVLVTVLGWLAFVKGILRVCIPAWCGKMMMKFSKLKKGYHLLNGIVLVLGLYLCYIGFITF